MVPLSHKDFVVWYKSGAGGFFVSWLIQLAKTPHLINDALDVFPSLLNNNATHWKRFERTPPDVGVLCNMFHPNTYYTLDLSKEINLTLDNLLKEDYSFDNLLHCRIKYYLVNYVYQSGHVLLENVSKLQNQLAEFHLDNPSYIKQVTDIVCNPARAVFVTAPEGYIKEASHIKKCRYYYSPINKIISSRDDLNTFRLESIWQGTWVNEIEKTLSTSLNSDQIQACQTLIARYTEVMPANVKRVCV